MPLFTQGCKPQTEGMSQQTPAIHTIFGAGQIGTELARQLGGAGHRVRLVRRSAPGEAMLGVTWLQGDALDPEFADRACQGAVAVYNCTNPPDYHRWDGILQPLYRAIWAAAGRAGARLVQLDNLYMYGKPRQVPFDEQTPMRPCTDKGKLRAALAEELMQLHAAGKLEVCIGRASDFFGAQAVNAMMFRPDVYQRIVQGKTVYTLANPQMPHSYSYVPDVARGLAILGTHEAAPGNVWHLPVAAQLTTTQLVQRFAAAAGTQVKVRQIPRWLLAGGGVFWPLLAAINEMNYQWEIPYLLDDGAFRRTFGVEPTPLHEAIDASLRPFMPTQTVAAAA